MKKPINLQVNIEQQFNLLRKSTFKDPLCFIDENIQNAQRSGAKNISVDVLYDTIVFVNDGTSLHDHSVLFHMGESSWSEEIVKNETPFGLGFFSNISISDFIVIESGNLKTTFLYDNGSIEIYSEEMETPFDGFKLTLHDYKTVNTREIRERVKMIGSYVKDITVSLDSSIIEKIDYTKGKGIPYELLIDDEHIKGSLYLKSNHHFTEYGINIFHNGRFVKKLTDSFFIFGELHISNEVVTLESPDRKDIIKDDKYHSFVSYLNDKIAIMVTNIIQNAPDGFISNNSRILSYYSNELELPKILKLNKLSFDNVNTDSFFKLLQKHSMSIQENDFDTIGSFNLFLTEKSQETKSNDLSFVVTEKTITSQHNNVSDIEEIDFSPHNDNDALLDIIDCDEYDSYETTEEHTRHKKDTSREDLSVERSFIPKEQPFFWVELNSISKFITNLKLAQEFNLPIFIIQNDLEKDLVSTYAQSNCQHISKLYASKKFISHISNLTLSPIEKRASQILEMLSRMYGFDENIFLIGDLMITERTEIISLDHVSEEVVTDYNVIAETDSKKVLVDRSALATLVLDESSDLTISLSDLKFIMLNLSSIVKQVSFINSALSPEALLKKTLNTLALA